MADDGGLSRIQQRLNAIPQKLRDRMKVVTREEAEKLADDMRHFAWSSKDTGDLINSIHVTPAGQSTPPYSQPGGSTVVPENAAMVTVGNRDVRYPHLIEYGTSETEAQPYFWPAVRANKKQTLNRIKREIRKIVKANWGK
ncbi:HK97 gp10 family phage protein [Agrobacterium sp. S2/73]|uniref:HK97-gp10 family putative phage morphogenesis protein n=1 Tax=unclassified Agrobacterium TaxID=2632611 RepID=UPI001ADBF41D|nr:MULTISPECIES: HK97-gp10 family putative phage morphogenesis protein [unclassified Agrobacterium]MBO9108700.1 HK97 gp10 family phage protein [Agrobacterium sp. S2/73]QXZ73540.1 HK97 gp10 family phage protein [Agrobacterium sp. S7/73]